MLTQGSNMSGITMRGLLVIHTIPMVGCMTLCISENSLSKGIHHFVVFVITLTLNRYKAMHCTIYVDKYNIMRQRECTGAGIYLTFDGDQKVCFGVMCCYINSMTARGILLRVLSTYSQNL
jgi:hypothetical protein